MIDFIKHLLESGQDFTALPWIAWIIVVGLILRLVMVPLTLKRYRQMDIIRQINPAISSLHKKYAKSPEKYREAFTELYGKNHINPITPVLSIFATLVPVVILGYALFELRNDFASETFFGSSLNQGVASGDPVAISVWAISVVLVGISGYIGSRAIQGQDKKPWTNGVMILLPMALQAVFSIFLPMYFVVYIAAMVIYGSIESALMRRKIAKDPYEAWLPENI